MNDLLPLYQNFPDLSHHEFSKHARSTNQTNKMVFWACNGTLFKDAYGRRSTYVCMYVCTFLAIGDSERGVLFWGWGVVEDSQWYPLRLLDWYSSSLTFASGNKVSTVGS